MYRRILVGMAVLAFLQTAVALVSAEDRPKAKDKKGGYALVDPKYTVGSSNGDLVSGIEVPTGDDFLVKLQATNGANIAAYIIDDSGFLPLMHMASVKVTRKESGNEDWEFRWPDLGDLGLTNIECILRFDEWVGEDFTTYDYLITPVPPCGQNENPSHRTIRLGRPKWVEAKRINGKGILAYPDSVNQIEKNKPIRLRGRNNPDPSSEAARFRSLVAYMIETDSTHKPLNVGAGSELIPVFLASVHLKSDNGWKVEFEPVKTDGRPRYFLLYVRQATYKDATTIKRYRIQVNN